MFSHYPPLYTLITFEVVARHQSFSKAAEELHLSQSAISRHIFLLEESLERKLFDRSAKRVQLTNTGKAYLAEIEVALTGIKTATGKISKAKREQSLTLATSSSVAHFWLMPKLALIKNHFPQIKLRLLIIETLDELKAFEFDVAIYYSATPPTQYTHKLLFKEKVFAVCAPNYIPKICSTPAELFNYPLINLDAKPQQWKDWKDWFFFQNIPFQANTVSITANSYPVAIEFAIKGFGISLAWEGLVDECFKTGKLQKACPVEIEMPGAFYLIEHQYKSYTPAIRTILSLLEK